ncbi:hypothetical protein N0V90_009115 [Kalmusia sp. IMI 367209]|nr:hypothetical protein N0V90_009115 [Kalmusia sp. IMI 367209]
MKWTKYLSLLAAPIAALSLTPRDYANSTSPIAVTKRATFSSPPFNIQNDAGYAALFALIEDLASDPAVKVIVFDSNVPDFYIAHFDLVNPVATEYVDNLWPNMTRLIDLPIVTVAAVRGIAHGGGAEFAAALDVRFGSKEKAVFGQLELGIGSLPGGGGISLLPRLVGRSRAIEVILGAQDFDADTAASYGWINRAIADAEFDDYVDTFARRVASFDKAAIVEAKRIINKRAVYPIVEEQAEDWSTALGLLSTENVQARLAKIAEMGMQKDVDFEANAAEKLELVQGEGPWDV